MARLEHQAAASYDAMAEAFERHAEDSLFNAYIDRPAVLRLLGDVAGCRLLDVGCGPSHYVDELLQRGASVVAIDISWEMVARTHLRVGDRATVIQQDLSEGLAFADDSFAGAIAPLMISYIEDRSAALRELHRVLRPDARLVVSFLNPVSLWLTHGGAYLDEAVVTEEFAFPTGSFSVECKRFPLSRFVSELYTEGFVLELIEEAVPIEAARDRFPEAYDRLMKLPPIVVVRARGQARSR